MIDSQTNMVISSKKPIDILFFSSFGNNGNGGQESLFYLVSNLDRSEFRPHVVVPTEDGLAKRLKMCGIQVNIIELPKVIDFSITKKLRAFRSIIKLIEKYKIKILHTDGPRNTFYAGLAAKLKKKPLIWHVRSLDRDCFDRLLHILSSKIIIVADALRSRFDFKDNSKRFITIHNGIDLSQFKPQAQNEFVRKKYKIRKNELLIVVTARVERKKGQKYLIEACGHLQNKIPPYRIQLAGEITESSYLKECQDKASEMGIVDRVIFSGKLENVNQVLNATDIFVLPSLTEAFPRSVIEAMAAAKPVIATNVGGCSEAFEDEISGFLVPAKNPVILAEKILLLAKKKNLREKIGNEARYRVEKLFEIKEKVKQTEKLYYKVL